MIFYIVCSISNSNPGLGGHYFSLIHIAEAVSQKEDVAIINIGNKQALALKEWKGKLWYIETSFLKVKCAANELITLCSKYNPLILHAFDKAAGYYARKAGASCNIPWILTKCGGPNPSHKKVYQLSRYYPQAQVQTVFHRDDYEWFAKRFLKPAHLELIPARVSINFSKRDEFPELKRFYEGATFKIIRIARFSSLHALSIYQSIQFTKKMNETGLNAKLALIGNVHSVDVYNKVKSIAGNETFFFASNSFTRKASDFLPLADIAIGAGRSFMEGCAAGCVMMAPVRGSKYPALVTNENVDYFEAQNFSDRTMPNEKINPDRDIMHYINKIKNNQNFLKKEMYTIFKNRYDVKNAAIAYIKLYKKHSTSNKWQKKFLFDSIIYDLWIRLYFVKLI